MRREQKEKEGIARTATVLREEVPCHMVSGADQRHHLVLGLSDKGDITYLSATCPMRGKEYEAIQRLGGSLCADAALAMVTVAKEGVYGNNEIRDRLPRFAKLATDAIDNRASSLRYERNQGRKTREPNIAYPTPVPKVLARTLHLLQDKVRAATKLPCIRIDVTEECWNLFIGHRRVATRGWGVRGWQFDEVLLCEHLEGLTDEFFVSPDTGRAGRSKGDDKMCIACNKSFTNRRGHTATARHHDNVIKKLRTAMKLWPGPKESRSE